MLRFPNYPQHDSMDCGPTCVRIIAAYFGKFYSLQNLRDRCRIDREGVSMLGISEAAEQIGFRTVAVKLSIEKLVQEAILPCIVHWRQNHFVVLYKINRRNFFVSDPAKGLVKLSSEDFIKGWISTKNNNNEQGIVLILEPGLNLQQIEETGKKGISYIKLATTFLKHKRLFIQLFLGLITGSILQLLVPFLTQSVVDQGIATKDLNFITLVLFGQVMLFLGSTVLDFIRSWILLHISARINLSLLSEFLIKLLHLPISFFDSKKTADIIQRMGDHSRIENYLSVSTMSTLFSVINFILYGILIILYSPYIFFFFLIGSVLYFLWILAFLGSRRTRDYKRFELSAKNQGITLQLIQGIQEIKLNNAETIKRWEWERVQAKLFKLNISSLQLNQLQQGGALFINQSKNIAISFLSAQAVVNGEITLGAMLAIQYIIGQLNAPVQQFIQFIQSSQDAKMSMERINEIHEMEEEEPLSKELLNKMPEDKSFRIHGLSYKYPGYDNDYVLNRLKLDILEGEITAIVGMSGSGKTTLLKLLMKFYGSAEGEINLGSTKLKSLSHRMLRSKIGVVSQEGYIFSDTIANNIAVWEEHPDLLGIIEAAKVANIHEFITELPLGYNTRIGSDGTGISQGQKQRLLIARAVYKNPDFIFFDEATNSLDANNEMIIMNNLNEFFKGRTVVIVAHRLSTVKNADKIVVLNKGSIVEMGKHDELVGLQGDYYRLVKNQLELGA